MLPSSSGGTTFAHQSLQVMAPCSLIGELYFREHTASVCEMSVLTNWTTMVPQHKLSTHILPRQGAVTSRELKWLMLPRVYIPALHFNGPTLL
jgi:hypothetical protein